MTTPDDEGLAILRDACGQAEGPIERHSLRVFRLAERLARDRPIDRELLLTACWLHDAGLYPPLSTMAAYVTDGRRVGEALARRHGWDDARVRLLGDAIECHHAQRSQAAKGLEVELLRVADRVDVSKGLLTAGLPRDEVRALRREIPVDGFVAEVARGLARSARRRPASLVGIFFPPRR
jgi:HD domain